MTTPAETPKKPKDIARINYHLNEWSALEPEGAERKQTKELITKATIELFREQKLTATASALVEDPKELMQVKFGVEVSGFKGTKEEIEKIAKKVALHLNKELTIAVDKDGIETKVVKTDTEKVFVTYTLSLKRYSEIDAEKREREEQKKRRLLDRRLRVLETLTTKGAEASGADQASQAARAEGGEPGEAPEAAAAKPQGTVEPSGQELSMESVKSRFRLWKSLSKEDQKVAAGEFLIAFKSLLTRELPWFGLQNDPDENPIRGLSRKDIHFAIQFRGISNRASGKRPADHRNAIRMAFERFLKIYGFRELILNYRWTHLRRDYSADPQDISMRGLDDDRFRVQIKLKLS